MAVTADKPAPYATSRTILDIIERYRSRGLASPINADVLRRASVPESLIARTLQALETLDLIDEAGKPTPIFEGIRLAPETEFKKRLEEWLKGAYADVFTYVDPTTDDETRIRDAFRTYQPVGQQSRMVSLFQGLCAAANLLPENTVSQSSRLTTAAMVADPRLRGARAAARRIVAERFNTPRNNTIAPNNLPPALAGLLASLPPADEGWTAVEREKFLTTFKTVLDYSIPIIEEEGAKTETAATKKATAA
jgi:hypothetical protein